jgi:hypothetical protein
MQELASALLLHIAVAMFCMLFGGELMCRCVERNMLNSFTMFQTSRVRIFCFEHSQALQNQTACCLWTNRLVNYARLHAYSGQAD